MHWSLMSPRRAGDALPRKVSASESSRTSVGPRPRDERVLGRVWEDFRLVRLCGVLAPFGLVVGVLALLHGELSPPVAAATALSIVGMTAAALTIRWDVAEIREEQVNEQAPRAGLPRRRGSQRKERQY